jgi:hypothetical protein
VNRLAFLLVALFLAGCGGESGTATLKITRDRGHDVLLVAPVPAGLTAMQALERKAKVTTSYGGRFVDSINGVASAPHHDWFYFVNGKVGDRSAVEIRLRNGDKLWWDYRAWTNPNVLQGTT